MHVPSLFLPPCAEFSSLLEIKLVLSHNTTPQTTALLGLVPLILFRSALLGRFSFSFLNTSRLCCSVYPELETMANRVTAEHMTILLEYVTYEGGNTAGRWTCRKCFHRHKGRPNQIVSHLLCMKNRGVKICKHMKEIPHEREELAGRLGQNPQPEQVVIPMEETFSVGALLEDNNDGVEEINAVDSEMISTPPQGLSSQPDSTQPSSPRGMDMCMDDRMPTPHHINFHRMYRQYVPLPEDGATVDPSMAASSMDIEGQQQLQPGEEGNTVNNLGDAENTSSRAVIFNVCANREDRSNIPDLGSAGREGGASSDVRMQNAVSQEKGSKKRKCAPGTGASATALHLDNSEQSSSISVSNLIISPPETSDASMSVPRGTCIPPSHGQERVCVPNTNSGVVRGTIDVDFEPNNTIHEEQSSLPDSVQVSSPQEGMGMSLGDQIPHRSQGNSDHANDEDAHPLQDEAGIDASTPGNAFGVGMASEPGLADPPPCPTDFPSDLWDLFLRTIDGSLEYDLVTALSALDLRRKDRLACLASACSEVKEYFTNVSDSTVSELRCRLYQSYYANWKKIGLDNYIPRFHEIERNIREEAELGASILGVKWKMTLNLWLRCATVFNGRVNNLDIDATKAKSPTDILQVVKRLEDLVKRVRKLIETGKTLLNPVPEDLLSWCI